MGLKKFLPISCLGVKQAAAFSSIEQAHGIDGRRAGPEEVKIGSCGQMLFFREAQPGSCWIVVASLAGSAMSGGGMRDIGHIGPPRSLPVASFGNGAVQKDAALIIDIGNLILVQRPEQADPVLVIDSKDHVFPSPEAISFEPDTLVFFSSEQIPGGGCSVRIGQKLFELFFQPGVSLAYEVGPDPEISSVLALQAQAVVMRSPLGMTCTAAQPGMKLGIVGRGIWNKPWHPTPSSVLSVEKPLPGLSMQPFDLRIRLRAGESTMTFLTGYSRTVQGKSGRAAIAHDLVPGVTVHTLKTPLRMDILGQAVYSPLRMRMSLLISQDRFLKEGIVIPLEQPIGIRARIVGLMALQALGIRYVSSQSMQFWISWPIAVYSLVLALIAAIGGIEHMTGGTSPSPVWRYAL